MQKPYDYEPIEGWAVVKKTAQSINPNLIFKTEDLAKTAAASFGYNERNSRIIHVTIQPTGSFY